MIYAAGIDVGSTQTKGIILNDKFEIVARALTDTGAYVTRAAERCFVEARILKADRKRTNRLRRLSLHHCDDERRVNASGQKSAHRHVGHQVLLHD